MYTEFKQGVETQSCTSVLFNVWASYFPESYATKVRVSIASDLEELYMETFGNKEILHEKVTKYLQSTAAPEGEIKALNNSIGSFKVHNIGYWFAASFNGKFEPLYSKKKLTSSIHFLLHTPCRILLGLTI